MIGVSATLIHQESRTKAAVSPWQSGGGGGMGEEGAGWIVGNWVCRSSDNVVLLRSSTGFLFPVKPTGSAPPLSPRLPRASLIVFVSQEKLEVDSVCVAEPHAVFIPELI